MTAHWLKNIYRLDGAFSDHTLRSCRSDFGLFSAYIEAERIRLKPGTLKRRLAAIRKLHRLAGEGDPTRDADVDLAMRRASRAQPSRPQQALGITAERQDRLLNQCTDDLVGFRDKVLVSVGFDILCRRGELVALAIPDLTMRDDGRYSVLIRRAKNESEGAGRTTHLSTRSSQLADEWLAAIGATRGPPLRPIYRSRALSLYLKPLSVARVLKKLSERAELQAKGSLKVSSHSFRVGAAQQLVLNDRGILQVMRAGGWRSMDGCRGSLCRECGS